MPRLNKEIRAGLLQALTGLTTYAEQTGPRIIYPVPEHLRALESDVVLIVGDRGAGKTQLRNALDDTQVRDALVRHAPGVRVPQGEVQWKVGWPLQAAGPDSTAWRTLVSGGAAPDDWVAIWGAYLVRSVRDQLTSSEQDEVRRVLDVRGLDARAVLAAQREVGVSLTAALDAIDDRLAQGDRWMFVSYDELDTLVPEDWATLGMAIRGLVSFWAAYARRWRRLRPKVFLRSDFYKHHREIAGADVAKLAGNRVELQWSDKNLYGALLKHVLNPKDSGSAGIVRDHLGSTIKTRDDQVLGCVPVLATAADAKPFVDRLVSEYMGANEGKGRSFRWILDHLRDGNGHALPRSLVALIGHAAEIERDRPRAQGAHLLHHVSIRNALDRVSTQYVDQAKTHELPWLGGLASRLQRDREVPWTRRELVRLLTEDFEESWSTNEARPPGASPEELLQSLVELGVIRARPNDTFDVPDLYLHGFDLRRKGGVAKK